MHCNVFLILLDFGSIGFSYQNFYFALSVFDSKNLQIFSLCQYELSWQICGLIYHFAEAVVLCKDAFVKNLATRQEK